MDDSETRDPSKLTISDETHQGPLSPSSESVPPVSASIRAIRIAEKRRGKSARELAADLVVAAVGSNGNGSNSNTSSPISRRGAPAPMKKTSKFVSPPSPSFLLAPSYRTLVV